MWITILFVLCALQRLETRGADLGKRLARKRRHGSECGEGDGSDCGGVEEYAIRPDSQLSKLIYPGRGGVEVSVVAQG